MRRFPTVLDVELSNAAEIDAALEAALSAPLNELLTNEAFAAKLDAPESVAAPSPGNVAALESEASDGEAESADSPATLPFPISGCDALERAA